MEAPVRCSYRIPRGRLDVAFRSESTNFTAVDERRPSMRGVLATTAALMSDDLDTIFAHRCDNTSCARISLEDTRESMFVQAHGCAGISGEIGACRDGGRKKTREHATTTQCQSTRTCACGSRKDSS